MLCCRIYQSVGCACSQPLSCPQARWATAEQRRLAPSHCSTAAGKQRAVKRPRRLHTSSTDAPTPRPPVMLRYRCAGRRELARACPTALRPRPPGSHRQAGARRQRWAWRSIARDTPPPRCECMCRRCSRDVAGPRETCQNRRPVVVAWGLHLLQHCTAVHGSVGGSPPPHSRLL